MTLPLQVIEPTLEDYAGHCHALVTSLVRASAGAPIDLWSGQGSQALTFGPDVTIHPMFRRRHRALQMLRLLHGLIRSPGRIVMTTAGTRDLLLLALAARGRIPPDHVFLCFHWLRETPGKLRFLRAIARRQPDIVILGTTDSVVNVFRRCGFTQVALLPYPAPEATPTAEGQPFRQLLYAGAARQDKGFKTVVDLVQLLAARNADVPITVQATPDHYGKYDAATREDIARLESITYAPLALIRSTPGPSEYAANFPGSICLQPYDRAEFRDRVSGVTLDALAHGCPIVATAGTWSAALIEPFHAGIALADPDAESLYDAVAAVRAEYPRYRSGALAAANARGHNSWGALLERFRS